MNPCCDLSMDQNLGFNEYTTHLPGRPADVPGRQPESWCWCEVMRMIWRIERLVVGGSDRVLVWLVQVFF